jgi:hypothetical protein
MNVFRHGTPSLLAALALFATPAAAFDLADGKLDIGVAGEAAYGRTNGNTYSVGNEEGQYDNTKLGIIIMGHLSDRLSVASRIDLEGGEGTEAQIDWAFAEWKVSDALRFRAGKAKHPFGNYGETIEDGTLRPFFKPPTVMYGPAEMVGEGYTGVGLTGFKRLGDDWTLAWDLYGGEVDVAEFNSIELAFDPSLVPETDEDETREAIGGRISLETPIQGLTARVSAYSGAAPAAEGAAATRRTVAALSGEYLSEALSLRAEYALLVEKDVTTNAGYVEAAWMFKSGLQVAGRVEGSWSSVEGISSSSDLLRHQEAAVGVNYWFAPDFVIKAEAHLIDGNRFAYAPWDGVAPVTRPTPDVTTQLYLIGAQFSL